MSCSSGNQLQRDTDSGESGHIRLFPWRAVVWPEWTKREEFSGGENSRENVIRLLT